MLEAEELHYQAQCSETQEERDKAKAALSDLVASQGEQMERLCLVPEFKELILKNYLAGPLAKLRTRLFDAAEREEDTTEISREIARRMKLRRYIDGTIEDMKQVKELF